MRPSVPGYYWSIADRYSKETTLFLAGGTTTQHLAAILQSKSCFSRGFHYQYQVRIPLTRAETVKSLACIFSVSQSTLKNSLCNCQCLVQVTKCIQLSFFSFNINIKLFDSFKSQFFLFHKNSNWISHEFFGHFQHIRWHCGRKQHHPNTSI